MVFIFILKAGTRAGPQTRTHTYAYKHTNRVHIQPPPQHLLPPLARWQVEEEEEEEEVVVVVVVVVVVEEEEEALCRPSRRRWRSGKGC